MRKNAHAAWKSWQNGKYHKACDAIWSNGDDIYSYGTCIVTCAEDGTPILNRTRYSVTTSVHQNSLAAVMSGWCIVVFNIPQCADREQLRKAAREARPE